MPVNEKFKIYYYKQFIITVGLTSIKCKQNLVFNLNYANDLSYLLLGQFGGRNIDFYMYVPHVGIVLMCKYAYSCPPNKACLVFRVSIKGIFNGKCSVLRCFPIKLGFQIITCPNKGSSTVRQIPQPQAPYFIDTVYDNQSDSVARISFSKMWIFSGSLMYTYFVYELFTLVFGLIERKHVRPKTKIRLHSGVSIKYGACRFVEFDIPLTKYM